MADRKQMESSKIDALYSWLSYDLNKLKSELLSEMKYSSVQMGSLYQGIKADSDKSIQAVSQEIRYSYKQNQTIYDGLASLLAEEVAGKVTAIEEKTTSLDTAQEEIKSAVAEILESVSKLENVDVELVSEKVKEKVALLLPAMQETLDEIKYGYMQQQAIYDSLSALIAGEVISKLDDVNAKLALLDKIDEALVHIEDNDYKAVIESVAEKTEESVAEHSRQILEAVNAIPVAENVDYGRIVDEVGDKVIEILGEITVPEEDKSPVEAIIDYDKIVYGTAEKVVESLPYPEKVDYRRIDESFAKQAEKLTVSVSDEVVANAVSEAVAKAMSSFGLDALASAVAEKIVLPAPAEIDYERLADMVAEKLSAKEVEEPTYEVVVDEEGIETIANKVAEKLCERCAPCEVTVEEPVVEEVVEEVSEELVVEEIAEETVVEEVVEETSQESVEEPVVEEVAPVVEELAVTESTVEENLDNLVDAETGLVIRLKKSFTAKMKQSEEKVKQYYSDVKNELKSYKKINSNVSWHGDRFNFGRDTVAKMNICGKTLCFYLALDPENPEFKQTVYHQKDVGAQKAYESTPFMVKIKSDAAAKKALRLVGYLAEKLETPKDEKFEKVDYTEEFAYESTKQLFDQGYIKATKEKKVDLDF